MTGSFIPDSRILCQFILNLLKGSLLPLLSFFTTFRVFCSIFFAPFLTVLIVFPANAQENWGDYHFSYAREVGNQLFLSDFQLGSEETIKDTEGHGFSIGRFFRNDGVSFFLLNIGTSETKYQGTVEDGVNVGFSPQPGSGFEALSTSNNIFYEVDLEFSNPFISFTYTNWHITRISLESHYILPSTYGFGLIFQRARGDVKIKGINDILIAEASYESGIQRFFYLGWNINFEFLYLSILARHVTSPILKIDNCNIVTVGQLACDRIEAATGNRNNSTRLFTGGVFEVGVIF